MAKMIEGVTENILKCAKEEFLANGYENASLRNIAEKAGTTKSSLLYRYSDKEALYHSIPLALCFPWMDSAWSSLLS